MVFFLLSQERHQFLVEWALKVDTKLSVSEVYLLWNYHGYIPITNYLICAMFFNYVSVSAQSIPWTTIVESWNPVRLPLFKSLICLLIAVWLLVFYLISLHLSFPVYKKEMTVVSRCYIWIFVSSSKFMCWNHNSERWWY